MKKKSDVVLIVKEAVINGKFQESAHIVKQLKSNIIKPKVLMIIQPKSKIIKTGYCRITTQFTCMAARVNFREFITRKLAIKQINSWGFDHLKAHDTSCIARCVVIK